MAKSLLAWVVLIGFILLLVNLIFLHIELIRSLIVYVVIILLYLIFTTQMKKKEK